MKKKDFKIGNLVFFATTIAEVIAIHEDGIVLKYSDKFEYVKLMVEGVREIPITDEWFHKFGFELKEGVFWYDNVSILGLEGDRYLHFDGGRIFIRTVHQLQNLFFALTGKELTLKEN
ncbi:hypothetical protein [Chryseobacterium sp.]|uniref:hypothetical protein n=1 Tax=Chryseobacterium sp. TaxID=1871047 RepID=UPI00289A4DC1|nr:hypothetical protein [Chryseobacterium sp.]